MLEFIVMSLGRYEITWGDMTTPMTVEYPGPDGRASYEFLTNRLLNLDPNLVQCLVLPNEDEINGQAPLRWPISDGEEVVNLVKHVDVLHGYRCDPAGMLVVESCEPGLKREVRLKRLGQQELAGFGLPVRDDMSSIQVTEPAKGGRAMGKDNLWAAPEVVALTLVAETNGLLTHLAFERANDHPTNRQDFPNGFTDKGLRTAFDSLP